MLYMTLSGEWTLSPVDNPSDLHKGMVPGSVYSFLLADGSMEDPYWRDNELKSMDLMMKDWSFERDFEVSGEIASCPLVELDCQGLDTLADIYINGTHAGYADNMHRHWAFPVTSLIKEGSNHIKVVIHSPVKYIREMDDKDHWGGTRCAMRGFPHIRKASCMFGWDWGPRLPDMGIWREIGIRGVNSSRITDWRVSQQHEDGLVRLSFSVEQEGNADVVISVTDPDGEKISGEADGRSFVIRSPKLWWPHGLGSQPLYGISIKLVEGGRTVDCLEKRIGLRTLTLTRKKDQWGESFSHCVNGVDFFAMGADYIPEDNVLSRVTPERTRKLLAQCKAANFNAIRVWGGGHYPSDEFYDACDELGIVVWQDMMFACANYPLDEEGFEENVSAEVVDNVRRLRHHASLGLWSGNNEMEEFVMVGDYEGSCRTKSAYIRLYEHVIPHIMAKEDPVTPYWPSSPSSGGAFDDPTAPDRGDTHCWTVWHGRVPFSYYRETLYRYVSEFGFQSFPAMATVRQFAAPEDWNIFSRVMDVHQRNDGANGLIMSYLAKNYLYPQDFEVLLYASQLLQAEAMRYGVEHWRRHRGCCMGAIYWQLNDIWPVASWSSIDYFGRWKALHYYARRFFSPLLLSCEEFGESQAVKWSINDEPDGSPVPMRARLSITNETRTSCPVTALWQLRDASGNVIEDGRIDVIAEPLSAAWIGDLDFTGRDFRSLHLSYQMVKDGKELSSASVLFTEPKYYRWEDPCLELERDGNEIVIRAKAYAKSVEIYSEDGVFVLSDNYFDMEPGEKRVRILEENGVTTFGTRSVWDIR